MKSYGLTFTMRYLALAIILCGLLFLVRPTLLYAAPVESAEGQSGGNCVSLLVMFSAVGAVGVVVRRWKFVFIISGAFVLLSACTLLQGPNLSQPQIAVEITASPTVRATLSLATAAPKTPSNTPIEATERPTWAATNTPSNTPIEATERPTWATTNTPNSTPTATATSTHTPLPTTSTPTNVPLTATPALSLTTSATMMPDAPTAFVTVSDGHFMLFGRPHYFVGTNFWQGMNLGVAGPSGNRPRLIEELNHLQRLGVTNIRVMASSEGPETEPYRITPVLMISPGVYNQDVFDGLDYLLMELGKRDMRTVMVLNNYWQWSGGMAQYVSWHEETPIPYQDWPLFMDYSAKFYDCLECQSWYRQHIETMVNHINSYTGLRYRDDPTIFSWELANEPRRFPYKWIDETAAYIKSLDPNHLVTTGSEGTPPGESQDFIETHNSSDIDYATIHIWPQNWGWYDPTNPASYTEAEAKARSYIQKHTSEATILGKPFVLEEFGLARNWEPLHDIYNPNSPTTYRDIFYSAMFEEIYTSILSGGLAAGDNFWVWSGQVQTSDNWPGDPPHETPGWYSVYDTDETTKAIISAHAMEMANIQELESR